MLGGINFGWLAVWGASPDWLKPNGHASIIRRLGEAAATAEGVRAVPRLCIYTLAIALQLRKITENLSQGIRKALGLITLMEISQYLYGEGSSWKEVWANWKEGKGAGIESTQQAVGGNGPSRCHWWECVGGNQFWSS
jgi:hypothetical protein